MEQIVQFFSDWTLQDVAQWATAIVTAAAAIAAVTPSKSDNKYVQKAMNILNALGLNVNKAKNKDA